MRYIGFGGGLLLVVITLWDMFETVILPRTVTRNLRLTRMFYLSSWAVCRAAARLLPAGPGEELLGAFGPLSLPILLGVWAGCLISGFSLMEWGVGSQLVGAGPHPGFGDDIYLGAVTFFTLGYGDITPSSPAAKVLAVATAGVGFAFLAIVISYLPVLYQSFSRREVGISMLDSRAGSPPIAVELLKRYGRAGEMDELVDLLRDFERWAADMMESHLSYPVLTFYRSQHSRVSWLGALTTVMDICALLSMGFEDEPPWARRLLWQARQTFAMARHAAVDLTLILHTAPEADSSRLGKEDLPTVHTILEASGIRLRSGAAADEKLTNMRRMYEPYVQALAKRLCLDLPPWMPDETEHDNWQTTAWETTLHF